MPRSEKEQRILHTHSDVSVEIDYALAAELLGDPDEARVCLKAARDAIEEWEDYLE